MVVGTSSKSSPHGCWGGVWKRWKNAWGTPPPGVEFPSKELCLARHLKLSQMVDGVIEATKTWTKCGYWRCRWAFKTSTFGNKRWATSPTQSFQHNYPKHVVEARETLCSKCGSRLSMLDHNLGLNKPWACSRTKTTTLHSPLRWPPNLPNAYQHLSAQRYHLIWALQWQHMWGLVSMELRGWRMEIGSPSYQGSTNKDTSALGHNNIQRIINEHEPTY